jgi:hypothetical protein
MAVFGRNSTGRRFVPELKKPAGRDLSAEMILTGLLKM